MLFKNHSTIKYMCHKTEKRKLFMAYLSLFFHAIVAFLLWPATLAGNHTDRLSLLAIKKSITQDPQRVLDTWNTSLHFCLWQGVTCGRRHPRVTRLHLRSRGLVGILSPHVGNLSFLREISLSNNSFNGVIPPQLGGLFRLQNLFLTNNTFEGEVPASLSNCTRLNILGLGGNELIGKLPQELGLLVNLTALDIRDNRIGGGMPSFFGNLTSLEFLQGYNNRLRGKIPDVFGQLHSLGLFDFGMNRLHGMFPPSLYNLTSLTDVNLYDNHISGGLSEDIGLQLPNLVGFYIWGNKLKGSIPSSLSNCSKLELLDLSENGFTGKVNINFRHIPNLTFLALYLNSLGSSEPDEMNFIDSMINCSKLEVFGVQDNKLRGVLPSSLTNLSSQLRNLELGGNFIYGPLPSGIGNLGNLEVLFMRNNQLTGIIPTELGNLRNLKQLGLGNNKFTGNVPDSIGNLSFLLYLDLSVNRLEGQIPVNLGNCRSLTSLHLSTNNLSGPIPKKLFQISSLIQVNLTQNHLVGPLPQEIGNLKSLMLLSLSENDLVGKIPDAIKSCTSLEYLYLDGNSFEGPIPSAIRNLRGIRELDLSSNNFSGKIPIFLEQLNFSALNLSFNNLDGEVPIRGIFVNASAIAINGNSRLCGGIPELGLRRCNKVARPKKGFRVILVVIPLCSFLVLAMALSLLFFWQKRKRQAQPTEASLGQPFSRVSYGSIRQATNEFSEQNLIGTGTFSAVYKGILEEAGGRTVAIKVLKLGNKGAFKSFMAECEALKNIRHRNLVKIITSCSSVDYQGNDFKALIYEYMPNGNVDTWLHPSPQQEIETEEATAPRRLRLRQRLTIAIDVAHAIHYLHQECETPIIHCDLKPSNILLDNDMVAHIGDFGLAKFLPLKPHESSSIGIRGTIGYAAPEYGVGSEMTKEGDIYSFGIVLLEMVTGKRPTDEGFEEGMNLHGYVKMALPDRVMEIVETAILHELEEEMEAANVNRRRSGEDEARRWKRLEECMISLATIGVACSMESPRERMDSSKIVHELHRINRTLIPNRIAVGNALRECYLSYTHKHMCRINRKEIKLLMAYLSLLLHALIAFLLWPSTLAGNHTDHLSLLAIKSSITHDPQRVLDTWNTSVHFCQWQGVTCGRRHPRVTILDLGSRGLVGSLSPSLYNLTSLKYVDLSSNQISGALSIDIGMQLPNLEILTIWGNRFTGSIPSSFSNCSNLLLLDLSENGFTGKVNINFRHIPNLRFLILYQNSLGSSEPNEMNFIDSMINCSKLQALDVYRNQLRGVLPSSVANLSSQLNILSLGENFIYGSLPCGIGNLVKLVILSMQHNQLSGIIPSDLSNLRNLTRLYLNGNSFTGNIPKFLRAMKKLRSLDLSSNEIHGHVPDWAGKIGGNELFYLNLSHNFITGFPQFQWDRLEILDLRSNMIQGSFPPSICNARFLRYLDMSNNRFSGFIPQCVGDIISSNLHVVDLGNNSFHGTIPNAYKACGELEGFVLNGNHLEGKVPSFLSKCQSLKVLDLGNNHLKDTFPHWSAYLPNLQVLVLKSNKLHGPIENISMIEHPFPSLKLLDLSQNEFVGHLSPKYFQNFDAMKKVVNKGTKPEYLILGDGWSPDGRNLSTGKFYSVIVAVKDLQLSFSKFLTDYTIIDLSRNRFEGEIPNVIGSLNYLKVLNLSHNNLRGRIPHALGNLSKIESLDLSCNRLTGEIPRSLATITALEVLDLSQNQLVGRIPDGTQFKTFEAASFEGNLDLCGFPLPKPCEHVSATQLEAGEDEESRFTWKVVMLGYGCGTLIGLAMGYIMLSTGRPKWFNAIADDIEHLIQTRRKKRRYVYIGK
ncbi:hypothetical protein OSB04_027198 [Centaurea solstitialis]|uniref:non-specific serine/threonine protein kinase n=1 Tax=Centaurea solstitialis TaxID=347529 RepID=A0AA38VZG6_9ASTR|nr:hypothetical protein OSB04_027198 [Centaurea solstitialis]